MDLIYYLDIFGTIVFAVAGSILAMQKKMDIFGILVIGFITAVGGGTLRDILLNNHPIFWLSDTAYFFAILGAVAISFFSAGFILRINHILRLADAVGLGTFTIIGLQKADAAGLAPIFAVLMGVITAVAGGMMRDILCHKQPLILSHEVYATACIAGGVLYFAGKAAGIGQDILTIICIAAIIIIRVLAVKFNTSLPRKHSLEETH